MPSNSRKAIMQMSLPTDMLSRKWLGILVVIVDDDSRISIDVEDKTSIRGLIVRADILVSPVTGVTNKEVLEQTFPYVIVFFGETEKTIVVKRSDDYWKLIKQKVLQSSFSGSFSVEIEGLGKTDVRGESMLVWDMFHKAEEFLANGLPHTNGTGYRLARVDIFHGKIVFVKKK